MSSYEKVVKLACKPKAAPPKAKYLDPIISATYSEEGAVHDVCKALAPRFKEPNAIVVFKALIVLHTMIRNGDANNLLTYLTSASSDVLRLRNVTTTQWDGYRTPENMANYAIYLDARVRAYKDLKHDVIRVQAENNRDMRATSITSPEEAKSRSATPQRSKTVMGRKLRVMTVEKGLLRETKVVQKMVDTLVACRFYLDDLEDELTLAALSMLVKDLLVLFQAGNEGVINVLEHYFEMSKIDAEEALALYRSFCKQTEAVVEYLGVAKKLQNLINVNIPNLRHAPVSLAGALEEYLQDPNFEQNRIEYKTQKALADAQSKSGGILKKDKGATSTPQPAKAPSPKPEPQPVASTSTASPAKPENQAMLDFFSSIEQEQTPMFNPQTGSPTTNYFQQQSAFNPFVQRQAAMVTGMPQQPFIQVQATGMVPQTNPFAPTPFQQPQMTGFAMPQASPFGPMNQAQPQPQGLFPAQTAAPLQQQATGMLQQPQPANFLRPQATGSNPFRQSVLMPQGTGFSPMAFGSPNGAAGQPFLTPNNAALRPMQTQSAQGMHAPPSAPPSTAPFGVPGNASNPSPFAAASIARPASTPITSSGSVLTKVATHQTGSKNPFGQPKYDPPPVPKPPTMAELAGLFGPAGGSPAGAGTSNNPFGAVPSTPQQSSSPNSGQSFGLMASIASSFTGQPQSATAALNKAAVTFPELDAQPTSTSTVFSDFSSLSFGSTPSTATAPSISINPAFDTSATNPIQPQATGFGGIKPFKPTSSFGAELVEKNPVKAQPTGLGGFGAQPTGLGTGLNAQPTGLGTGLSAFGATNPTPFSSSLGAIPEALTGNAATGDLNAAATSRSTVGVGLRPQATGAAGASNPFRASMMGLGSGSPSPFGALNANPTGLAGLSSNPTGINSLNSSTTTSPFGSAANSPFAGLPPPFSSTLGQNGTASATSTSPFSANPSLGAMSQNGTVGAFPGGSAFGLGAQNGTSPFPGAGASAGGVPAFGGNLFGATGPGFGGAVGQDAQKQQQGQTQGQFGSLI